MKKIVMLVALLMIPAVFAQLDWQITDLRCGNDVLDDFELCEKDVEESYCDELGTILEIDTVCDTQHCTCLPRVNKAYCGNNRREGVEVCDGTGEDLCGEFGNLTGMNLSCDPNTCGCVITDSIPQEYNPETVDSLVNASQEPAICGNKKVERDEDCDPANTLCTTSNDETGVCTDKCKCVTPEELANPEPEVVDEEPDEANETQENLTTVTSHSNVSVEPVPVVENTTEQPDDEPGFFGRIWNWFVSIFS
jgi:hypothetical protein